jgi:hypothetical protein
MSSNDFSIIMLSIGIILNSIGLILLDHKKANK